jgi:broad specificity phosphatase PhoE
MTMNHPLELLFVRHGEGEHMLDLPRSLGLRHPHLTEQGQAQIRALCPVLQLTDEDLVLASPTPRTIETARLLCGAAHPRRHAAPAVGPRMFPKVGYDPLPCDDLLSADTLTRDYPDYPPHPADPTDVLWRGINLIADARFAQAATDLFAWCRQLAPARVVIVAHDGTIHNYRRLLGEPNLTRATFLGPAGFHRVSLPG